MSKEAWYCDTCKNIFKKPDINTIIDDDGKEQSYPMCTSCDGWSIYKIEYNTEEELYEKMRLLE